MQLKTAKHFDRWYMVKHLIHRKRKDIHYNLVVTGRHGQAGMEYERKNEVRQGRIKLFNDHPEFAEFFNWLKAIKLRSGLDNTKFGKLLNVSARMVNNYVNWNISGGYFPSEETIRILESLERQQLASITIKRNYRIREGNKVRKVSSKEKSKNLNPTI